MGVVPLSWFTVAPFLRSPRQRSSMTPPCIRDMACALVTFAELPVAGGRRTFAVISSGLGAVGWPGVIRRWTVSRTSHHRALAATGWSRNDGSRGTDRGRAGIRACLRRRLGKMMADRGPDLPRLRSENERNAFAVYVRDLCMAGSLCLNCW